MIEGLLLFLGRRLTEVSQTPVGLSELESSAFAMTEGLLQTPVGWTELESSAFAMTEGLPLLRSRDDRTLPQ